MCSSNHKVLLKGCHLDLTVICPFSDEPEARAQPESPPSLKHLFKILNTSEDIKDKNYFWTFNMFEFFATTLKTIALRILSHHTLREPKSLQLTELGNRKANPRPQ